MPLASDWSSLEIAKLAVGVMTPLLLVGLGVLINRTTWSKQKLVEKRLVVFEEMAPLLNDFFIFFKHEGHFLEIDPPRALQTKRDLDKEFYVNKFLFEPEFEVRYLAFIDACFEGSGEFATPGKLRASVEDQATERGPNRWERRWAKMLTDEDDDTVFPEIQATYNALMEEFARQVGVKKRAA
jgi:hypothetical protein